VDAENFGGADAAISLAAPLSFLLALMERDMPITDIVAQRELEFVGDAGKESVQVYLGKPVQEMDGPWFCLYLIKAKSFERQFHTAGEDSMQALVLAESGVDLFHKMEFN